MKNEHYQNIGAIAANDVNELAGTKVPQTDGRKENDGENGDGNDSRDGD